MFGEGFNTAWEARLDGETLGAPVPVDGGFNGWQLPPSSEPREMTFRWTAQTPVTVGLFVSALAALALHRDRSRRIPFGSRAWTAPTDEPAQVGLGEPHGVGIRHRARGGVRAADLARLGDARRASGRRTHRPVGTFASSRPAAGVLRRSWPLVPSPCGCSSSSGGTVRSPTQAGPCRSTTSTGSRSTQRSRSRSAPCSLRTLPADET